MIQLHPDYLIFTTSQGESIPCSAETVTVELIGDTATMLDPAMVREAAAAVVHYFKVELGRDAVSVQEFSEALERVLNGLGFTVTSHHERIFPAADLVELVAEEVDGFELVFFKKLREEFKKQLQDSPEVVSFIGLRECVKRLLGAKRWCHRCEALSDQIVIYLRECLAAEGLSKGLVVR